MDNAPSNNEASSGTSALDDGLERKRFAELCDLLPGEVNWYDPITPNIVREIVIAIEERERKACAKVCRDLADKCRETTRLRAFGNSAPEMMQAYEFAEAGILNRSNAVLRGEPLAVSPLESTVMQKG